MVTALRHGWVLSIGAFVVTAGVSTLLGQALSGVDEPAHQGRPARILEPTPPPSWEPVPAGRPRPVPLVWGTLPEDARRRLEASLLPVRVAAGQYLLHQGDPPGSAYSIHTERFEVAVDGHVLRELGPGDIVGELALLTGESRSASIRARRDSSVLELRRAAFDDLTTTDARASRALLEQMAGRLRSVGSAPEPRPPDRSTVVSVVALAPGAPVVGVARVLASKVGAHRSTISFTSCEPAGLERAEQDYDKVILVGDGGASPGWRDFCLRQADVVVLVAAVDDRAATLPLEPVPGRQPELVLIGRDPGPVERAAWQAQTDAWDLTMCPGSLTTGLRVLGDRLAGACVGIVLGGGGARGLMHVGVLRELADCGVQVDRIAGSSIGAVIAAAHALGLDGAELEAAAYSTFVRGRNLSDFTLPTHSLVSGNRMRTAATRIYGEDAVIEGLPRQLWVVSTDLLSRSRRVHRRGKLLDAVLASSRIPGLFPPIPTEDGRLLVDGGVLDNLPVDLLVQRDEGPVVAVNVGGGSATRRAGKPAVPALGDTLLRAMMINSAGAVQTARSQGA